jgi:fatty-acyl-CoA synthase
MQHHDLLLGRFIDHAAKWHPRAGIVTGGGAGVTPTRITYAALREQSVALSGAFAAMGLRTGDRIATLAWNGQEHLSAWFAALGIGVSVHTLNPRIGADQLAEMVRQADDRILIISPDQADAAEAITVACPSIERVLILDEVGNGGRLPVCAVPVTSLGALRDGAHPHTKWGGFSEATEAGLCFTSGTTGAPKGVAYSHRSNYLVTLNLLQTDVMGIGARDTILAAVPMFHANAWGIPFAAPAAGARLVLPGRNTDGKHLAELIASEGVTLALGVPTVWLQLLDHLDAIGGELPSLERVVIGGSSIPQALLDRIETRLNVRALTSWGMTELSPLGTLVPATSHCHDAKFSGKVSAGVDLLLKDSDGVPLPEQRGVEGRLHVRGPSAVERYLGHDESATDADGWFDTGDLAVIDGDGNLAITGRAKDLIKSGGEWINPAEIEAIVGALPAVALVAVIARTHPKWGERPVVIVELAAGQMIDDAEIMAALESRVPRWWLPEEIVRVDAMPLALTGKLDKQALRKVHGVAQS